MKRNHLSDQEFKQFVDYLESENSIQNIVLWLCLKSGARQSEILRLTRESFDFEREILFIKGIKGSNNRMIPIHGLHRCKELVNEMENKTLGNTMSSSLGLVAQRRMIQRWFVRARSKALMNCPGISLHGLRHTFALRCYLATGKDIIKTQKIIGHKNLGSTGRYLEHLNAEDCFEDILQAMKPNEEKEK